MKQLMLLLVVLALSGQLYAQQNAQLYTLPTPWERYSHYVLTVRGGIALPTGAFSSGYIDKPTIQSYSAALDWMLPGRFSAGVEVNRTFYSKQLPRAIYDVDGQDISAVQTRTLQSMPVQGVLSYYFTPVQSTIRPYVQVAAGADLLNYTLYYGRLADQQQAVRFTYGAAAGTRLLFRPDGSFGADVRIKYNQTSFSYGYLDKGIGQINATVGLFYRWW